MKLKNERRAEHMSHKKEYDPDIEKVIIVGDEHGSNAWRAALNEAMETASGAGSGASSSSGSAAPVVGVPSGQPLGEGMEDDGGE